MERALALQAVLSWLQLILSFALVAGIIIHPAKSMGMGLNSPAQLFGSQKGAESGLNKVTGIIALGWFIVSILLARTVS